MKVRVAGYKAQPISEKSAIIPFTHEPKSEGWVKVVDWADVDTDTLEKRELDVNTRVAIAYEADAIRDEMVAAAAGAVAVMPEPEPQQAEIPTSEQAEPSDLTSKLQTALDQLRAALLSAGVRV